MTAKQFLRQVEFIDTHIESLIEEKEELEARKTAVKSSLPSGMPKGGTHDTTDTLIALMEKIDTLERRVNDEIARSCQVKLRVMDIIDMVEDARYRTLLELRYLRGCTWEKIAQKMNYEVRWVYELHGQALPVVQKLMEMQ